MLALMAGIVAWLVLSLPSSGSASSPTFARDEKSKAPFKVALLKSDATFRHFKEKQVAYDAIFNGWKDFLKESGIPHTTLKTADLEKGMPKEIGVLILPGAAVLSEQERIRIEAFAEEGGGVLLSWATGLYTPDGAWTGWDLAERLTGAKIHSLKDETAANELLFTVIGGESPLGAGLPFGQRLEIFASDELFTADKETVEAIWVSEKSDYRTGGIVKGTFGQGRALWFGFTPNAISGDPVQQRHFRKVLTNAIHWAGRQPIAAPPHWPDGAKMAFSFSVDVEDGFGNIQRIFPYLKESRLPATFFVVTEEGAKHPAAYNGLKIGEMAIHADRHTPMPGLPLRDQKERLQRAKVSVEGISRKPVTGYRPVEERYDAATLEAMSELGLEYIVIQPSNHMSPQPLVTKNGRTVYLLFRALHDDFLLIETMRLSDQEALRRLQQDLELARFVGGLYILPVHTTPPWGFLASTRRLDMLVRFLNGSNQDQGRWAATLGEVIEWWKKRKAVEITVGKKEEGRIHLSLTNRSEKEIHRYPVTLFLPETDAQVAVRAEGPHPRGVSEKEPSFQIREDRLFLEISGLKPQETRQYSIQTDGGEASSR